MDMRYKIGILLSICVLSLWLLARNSVQKPSLFDMQLPIHSGRPWQAIVADKRTALHELIPEEWLLPTDVLTRAEDTPKLVGDFIESLLDPETLEVTALDPVDIVARIREGTYTAVKVTRAFCKRAAYAHQLVKSPSAAFTAP
jgi:hypothetical protein